MKQTMKISPIPPSLNVYRNMNKYLLNRLKVEWSAIMSNEIRRQGIVPVTKPVNVTMSMYFNRRSRHDADNYACTAKFLFDPLVAGGILKDDSFEFIPSLLVRQGGFIKGEQYLIMEIEEIEEDHS